ncbi:MAG: hypothetical protein JXR88_16555 [Clostridia bacterium]|nr:hypothetical protein [Clostridia bacterium]
MKLSKREKNLLLLSVLGLVVVALYFYIIVPIHTNYDFALEQYSTVDTQYKILQTQLKTDAQMDDLIESYRDEISRLEQSLPSAIYLEEIIDVMFDHFYTHGVIINNITFSMNDSVSSETEDSDQMGVEKLEAPMSVEEILEQYENDVKLSDQVKAYAFDGELSYDNISYLSIGLNFQADYNQLKLVLDGIEKLSLTTIITDLNVSKIKDTEENQVSDNLVGCSLNLSIPFYYDNEAQKEYIFDYSFDKGEDYKEHGPFEYEIIENKEDEMDNIYSEPVVDIESSSEFAITLNASASDLPAQAFSYYAASDSELSLNANANERYDLILEEIGGTVYFKYANSIESYPNTMGNAPLSMIGSQIIINVSSSNRISKDDLAGMTLFLENNTSKDVIINIYHDDKEKPRFNVIVTKGSYEINRQ